MGIPALEVTAELCGQDALQNLSVPVSSMRKEDDKADFIVVFTAPPVVKAVLAASAL